MAKRDYYEVLGINKSASKDEIRSAYRKLAKKYHPDINHEPDAPKKFEEIQEAYDVLSDDNKRAQYDQFGMAAFSQGASTGGAGNPFGQGFSSQGFGDVDLGDIFNSFFGGSPFGNRRGSNSSSPRKGADKLASVRISFMDSIKGVKVSLNVNYEAPCKHCHGSGAETPDDLVTCPDCGGRGYKTVQQRTFFGVSETQVICQRCHGRGKIVRHVCHECQGEGYKKTRTNLEVNIPAGIISGQQLRVSGYGERGRNGGPNGDLIIEVEVEKDQIFERDGNDIHIEREISFVDAALGCKLEVPTVYRTVEVEIPSGTQSGAIIRLKGEGIKGNNRKAGDQYIHLKCIVPTFLSESQKDLLRQFQKEEAAKGNKSWGRFFRK